MEMEHHNIETVSVEVVGKSVTSLASFQDGWRILARHLDLDDKHLKETYLNDSSEDNEAFFKLAKGLLNEYVGRVGQNATITRIIDILIKLENENLVKVLKAYPNPSRIVKESTSKPFSAVDLPPGVATVLEAVKREEEQESNALRKIKLMQVLKNADSNLGRIEIFLSRLLNLLSKAGNRPVVVVSINGSLRSGKSFMANTLLKYLKYKDEGEDWIDRELPKGFHFAAGSSRVTSGIEAWNEPVIFKINQSREVAVILLDTQGLHDLETNTKENKIIFGLSALLSSVFIFNEMNRVNSLILQDLHSSLEFARFTGATGKRLKFQKMILLLRDYDTIMNEYGYGFYGKYFAEERNLWEHYFSTVNIGGHGSSEVNATRNGILECFEDVFVYAMAKPDDRRPDMPEFKRSDSWHPEFKRTVEEFCGIVFGLENSVKTVYGEEMTGSSLQHYVKKWIELILDSAGDEGELGFNTILETSAEIHYSRKISNLVKNFESTLDTKIKTNPKGIPHEEFEAFVKKSKEEEEENFTKLGVYGSLIIQAKYKEKLQEKFEFCVLKFRLVNVKNLEAEAERKRKEEIKVEVERRVTEQRKKDEIASAELRVSQVKAEVDAAWARVNHVVATRESFTKTVMVEKRSKPINISFGLRPQQVFDEGAYINAMSGAISNAYVKFGEYSIALTHLLNVAKSYKQYVTK